MQEEGPAGSLARRRRATRRAHVRAVAAVAVVAVLAVSGAVSYAVRPGTIEPSDGDDGPLRVVTTTTFLDDTVRRIGGEHVRTVRLMGPGVDPHLYQARASDLRQMRAADAVFAVGLYLEGSLMRTLHGLARHKPVVFAGEAIPEDRLLPPPAGSAPEEEHDPHVWFDPELWAHVVDAVTAQLAELDPAHADDYRRAGGDHRERVLALAQEAEAAIATIPPRSRVLVTSHDAFRYLGAAFGMDVVAVQGISTQEEAGTADITRVADAVVDSGVRSVFLETSVPGRTLDAVLAAVRQRGGEVRLGQPLYSDSAGDDGTPEGTYLGMVRANIDRIVEGLR